MDLERFLDGEVAETYDAGIVSRSSNLGPEVRFRCLLSASLCDGIDEGREPTPLWRRQSDRHQDVYRWWFAMIR
jgi:hypothetical protein